MTETQQIRETLERGYIEELAAKNMRIKQIKEDLHRNIKRGVPVSITEEMRILGIEDEIQDLINKAEIRARLARLYQDEDDEIVDEYEPFTPVFS